MKPILITNFSKYDLRSVEAFIQKHNFIGAYAVVEADAFTDDVVKMVTRYSLNVIVPVQCTETGQYSIQEIDKRNIGFIDRLSQIPAGKLSFLRESMRENGSSSILTIALNYPKNTVMVITNTQDDYCEYFNERDHVDAYVQSYQSNIKIDWVGSLFRRFEVIDFSVLKTIGIIDSMSM